MDPHANHHKQTGIVIDVPADKMFHLGRLREDGRENLLPSLEDQMTRIDGMNHEDLLRTSRRYAIIWVDHELGLSVENIDKEVIIDDWDVLEHSWALEIRCICRNGNQPL